MKNHIPNAVTCLNLFSGCLAITQIFAGHLETAAYLVGLAAAFDFADGLLARALHASSPIGKDLDSLADMVSFGVVPGAILFDLLTQASANIPAWLPYAGFIVTVFSALRLAKFNNDTRQTTSFIGLPTPACTLVVASLPLILAHDSFHITSFILNPWVLLGLTVLLSGLLVAEIPLFALKFKNLRWQDNSTQFIFLLLAIALLIGLQATAIPLVVLLYVLMSVVRPAVG
ncbi:CDP-alcohol phosphatidyltransferase family protein [Hymenobacter sp. BT186]|uniref:CDP-alcohol phosphatidyltransferase family protein n=1 Tax=Hymenobacter telluris TaxID=2816474 RepID=A0A939EW77_9BACT|nr:CDP-alcohol phosphatidyltransferase family protein [Hymenobacter telluris]MBO0357770.1 CDP-alcohol phosphatidyltransferase family protein [Hymenobacter telluris]MBW3373797.1 CDP-alcohol phosphatidyltransferase family protein [Hymenobacter norwichensis]